MKGFPGGTEVKNLPANALGARDTRSIPGSLRSPGIGNDKLLRYPCLGNPMDREAWQGTVHEVAKEWGTTQQLKQQNNVHLVL